MKVEWARLGDVLQLDRKPIEVRASGSYRKLGIYSWGRGIIAYPPTSGAEMGSLRYFRFPANALLLSNIQAWEQAVALTTEEQAANFVSSNRFLPYVSRSEAAYLPYVFHYLLSDAGHRLLKRASPGTQVRNRTLGQKLFENERIPLLPLDDQRRIAAHLDRTSAALAMADGEDALSSTPAHQLLERAVGRAGSVPLSEVLDPRRGVLIDESASYPIAGVFGFGRGVLLRESIRGEETKYKTLTQLQTHDVVYSKVKAFEGAVAVVPPEADGRYVSPEFPVFELDRRAVHPSYARHFLTSGLFRGQLRRHSSGIGARRERVSPTTFLSMRLPILPLADQIRLADRLDQIQRASDLRSRRRLVVRAILPAARNEIFSAMR